VTLTLDRVGPDPFDPAGLGPIVTVRWSARVGTVAGAARLWVPESVVYLWLAASPGPIASLTRPPSDPSVGTVAGDYRPVERSELASWWRAEAGFVIMPQGLKRLRVGGVLPLVDSRLTGTPTSPRGPVDLIVDLDNQDARFRIPACPIADSGCRLVRLESRLLREPRPREPIEVTMSKAKPMSQATDSPNVPAPGPVATGIDVPVTLTVELGRVSLTLNQLTDLKPGDVVELSRHSRSPVELTSNGRVVARGELILIDTDLGVRVTTVFL
jgi:type III secretion system YscQ/HrcQ family protein